MKRRLTLPLVLLLVLWGLWWQVPAARGGEDPMHAPWGQGPTRASKPKQRVEQDTLSVGAFLFRLPIVFFQRVISPVDGDRCPSYPTCSAYSIQAYQRHGALLGTLMTVDRLFHEASEKEFAPTIEVYGVARIYDPLSGNEFWRDEKRKTESKG
jgi:hypothetical protein